jgi:hypothetical protein
MRLRGTLTLEEIGELIGEDRGVTLDVVRIMLKSLWIANAIIKRACYRYNPGQKMREVAANCAKPHKVECRILGVLQSGPASVDELCIALGGWLGRSDSTVGAALERMEACVGCVVRDGERWKVG